MRAALIPIRAYKIVHTMGNTMAGGDNGGLIMVSLYSAVPSRVSHPARAPTASDKKIQNRYVFHGCFFMLRSPRARICGKIGNMKSRGEPADVILDVAFQPL